MRNYKTLAAASFAVLLLAACGSTGLGDVLGGGNDQRSYEIRGVVDSVDVNSRSLYLTNVSGMQSMLSGGSGRTARVYFDDRTRVEYQGRTYRPQDLERGDEVTIRVDESGNQLMAESINVTYDSGGRGSTASSNTSTIRGTVSYVDTARRTLELESTTWVSGFRNTNTGSRMTVAYDTNMSVDVQGRPYPVSNLERGDLVEVRISGSSSMPVAQSIVLVRDVNSR